MRDEEPGALVAAVGDGDRLAHSGPGAEFRPCLAVVAVAGEWSADHDDQTTVGVNDHLMVGGVPITSERGANWRIVKWARQYVTTSMTRSWNGRPQGRPQRTTSASSRRSALTSLRNCRGPSPVNSAIH